LGRNRCTATVAPVDHAVVMVLDQAGIFGQAFFEKVCEQAFSQKPMRLASSRFNKHYQKSVFLKMCNVHPRSLLF
jgi:hypothetical protein